MSHPKPRRFKTADNQYGAGRVHVYLYSSENRLWYCACRGPGRGDPFGKVVEDTEPVTCKRCLA